MVHTQAFDTDLSSRHATSHIVVGFYLRNVVLEGMGWVGRSLAAVKLLSCDVLYTIRAAFVHR